jgi:VRR-NUC domain
MTEHQIQVALVSWFRMAYPRLILFAIPNGGRRDIGTAIKLKQSGALAGVSDLFLMKANDKWHGLFIELKTEKGKPTDQQRFFIEQAIKEGYMASVCHGFDESQKLIVEYLQNKI